MRFLLYLIFCSSLSVAAAFPTFKDVRWDKHSPWWEVGPDFYRRSHTLVLVITDDNLEILSSKIESLKKQGAEAGIEMGEGELAIDNLIVFYNGKPRLLKEFNSEARPYDAPRRGFKPFKRLGRAIARRVGQRKKAPQKLCQGKCQMIRTIKTTMQTMAQDYLGHDAWRAAPLFAESSDQFICNRKRLRLCFNNNGPSQRILNTLGITQPELLNALIISPDGKVVKRFVGDDTDPIEVAAAYYKAKGVPGFDQEDEQDFVEVERELAQSKDIGVFKRLQALAKEHHSETNRLKEMIPTLEAFKNYLTSSAVCTNQEGLESRKQFEAYLFQVFAQVEHKIRKLLNSNWMEQWGMRDSVIAYIENAAILARRYLKVQKKHSQNPAELHAQEKMLHEATYNIYRQVAHLLKLEAEDKAIVEKRWERAGIDEFRNDKKWNKIIDAIETAQNVDSAHCQTYIASRNDRVQEPIPTETLVRETVPATALPAASIPISTH